MELNNKVASFYGLERAYPFLDRDLVGFLMAIPGEVQTRNGVPKALLRAALSDVLPEAIALRRSKGDYTHLVNEAVERDFPRIVHCLESEGEAVKRGYVTEDVLNKNLKRLGGRIQGPTCEVAWSLSKLTGFELWLRVFFGESDNGKEVVAERGSKPKPQTIKGGRR
jgi:asparagine synthase (glutamine-hydrolysing)